MDKFLRFVTACFSGPLSSLAIYWEAYGQSRALFRSGYLYVALLIALLTALFKQGDQNWDWPGTVLNVIPDMLGFSLGGYALLIGFGDRGFVQSMLGRYKDGSCSMYMQLNGAFVHFILVQATCLLLAVLVDVVKVKLFLFDFIGFFFFIYAILTLVAATLAILRFAALYDKYGKAPEDGFDEEPVCGDESITKDTSSNMAKD